MSIESGLDLLLVLLYAPGPSGQFSEDIRDITRLVKLIFLLTRQKEFERFEKEFAFEPHDYGPWAGEVFDAIQTLKELELLKIGEAPMREIEEVGDEIVLKDEEAMEAPRSEEKKVPLYSLSDKGKIVAKTLFEELSPAERRSLVSVKKIYNNMPLTDLLRIVYAKYPELTTKSKIKDKFSAQSMFGVSNDLPAFTRDEEDFRN